MMTALLAVALATLVSEDLATIAAAGLVQQGQLDAWPAIAACSAGVYVGDLGLWLLGRLFGRRALELPWISQRLDAATVSRTAVQLDRRLGTAVLCSRFVPGTRLPMYITAGVLGRRASAFAVWSLVAVLVWTPLLVGVTLYVGTAAATIAVGHMTGLAYQGVAMAGVAAAVLWLRRLTPGV